jgi:PAS domain-containing protein
MAQQEVEVILMRQLASYLTTPILLVDAKGDLVFFNEAAEPIIGCRFDEAGAIRRGDPRSGWSATFEPTDENGSLIPRDEQVLSIATDKREPAHRRFWIRGLDGIPRNIEGLAFPLEGQSSRMLGAVLIFWEVEKS